MYKYGMYFDRDMVDWIFNKFQGTNYSAGTDYYYITGEDRFILRGAGTIAEAHTISTRIVGSQSYIISATAAGTGGWGSNMFYIWPESIYNSGPVSFGETYYHYENITKPATNCTRVDATFGFFDDCSFNEDFKFFFMRMFCGTYSHPVFGSRQLANMDRITITDGFDQERNMDLYQQSWSRPTFDGQLNATWVGTFIFAGTNGCGQDMYPEEVIYYGSISFYEWREIKRESANEFFGEKEVSIANGDVVRATIYLEF